MFVVIIDGRWYVMIISVVDDGLLMINGQGMITMIIGEYIMECYFMFFN